MTRISLFTQNVTSCDRWQLVTFAITALFLLIIVPANAQMTVSGLLSNVVDDPDSERYTSIKDAMVRFGNRDLDGARTLLDETRGKNPHLPPTNVMLAKLFLASNQLAPARSSLEQATMGEPNDPEPYVLFGELALRERRITDAGQLIQRAITLNETYTGNDMRKRDLQSRSFRVAFAVSEAREDWTTAKKYAEQWRTSDNSNSAARTQLARAQFKLDEEKEAYKTLTELYKEDDTIQRPEITMALLYEQSDNDARAKALMKLAIDRAGTDLNTRLSVANWAIRNNNVKEAEKHVNEATRLDKTSLQAMLLSGLVARYSKDWSTAETAFSTAHAQSPANFDASNQLALSLIEQAESDKKRRALEFSQINAQAFGNATQPRSREAMVTYAWVLFKMGRVGDAVNRIRDITQRGNVGGESAYFAARILSEAGLGNASAQLLKPVIDSETNFPTRHDAIELFSRVESQ